MKNTIMKLFITLSALLVASSMAQITFTPSRDQRSIRVGGLNSNLSAAFRQAFNTTYRTGNAFTNSYVSPKSSKLN